MVASASFLVLWGTVSELAAVFQCRIPHTWDFGHSSCFDIVSSQQIFTTTLRILKRLGGLVDGF